MPIMPPKKKCRLTQVSRITSDIRDGSSSNLGQDMQIQSMRTRYSAVLKQIHGIERPGHSLNTGHESSSANMPSKENTRNNPPQPARHRSALHQARVSYADEARVGLRIQQLQSLLSDIHRLQNDSSRLGTAMYA